MDRLVGRLDEDKKELIKDARQEITETRNIHRKRAINKTVPNSGLIRQRI